MRVKTALLIALTILIGAGTVHAERYGHLLRMQNRAAAKAAVKCTRTLDVGRMSNVLYKNANVHGGRGRSFLDQDHLFHGNRTLNVYARNGTRIGCFGLYQCDSPFGCRYYQAMCGDPNGNSTFAALARKYGGTTTAAVTDGSGLCMLINTTAARYGSVRK